MVFDVCVNYSIPHILAGGRVLSSFYAPPILIFSIQFVFNNFAIGVISFRLILAVLF